MLLGHPGKALSETAFSLFFQCVPNSNLHARAPPCREVIAVCFHANVAERACVRGGGCPTRTTWVIIHPARALVVPAGQTKHTGCGVDHITRVKYRNDLVSLVRRFLPQNLTARPTCACKKKREGRNAQRFPHAKWVHAGARTPLALAQPRAGGARTRIYFNVLAPVSPTYETTVNGC